MTEEQWLGTTDPHELLLRLGTFGTTNTRKLRLLAVGTGRLAGFMESYTGTVRRCFAIAEAYADHHAIPNQLRVARAVAGQHNSPPPYEGDPQAEAAEWVTETEFGREEAGRVLRCARSSLTLDFAANIVREIFGNPFRPVAVDPGWRTPTVMQLARGIYDNRNFGDLPILADALQDAGCDCDDILDHFRDANATHVRGCWALDLVLGKE